MSVLPTSQETGLETSAASRARRAAQVSRESTPEIATGPLSAKSGWFRGKVLAVLSRIHVGELTLIDPLKTHTFGKECTDLPAATIEIYRERFYRDVVLGGSLGAAESYIRGDWNADDLTGAMRVLAANEAVLQGVDKWGSRLLRPIRTAMNRLRDNTLAGSRRNIAAHYDLSNEFFALWLDPTMTYSSGVFPAPGSSLQEASIEKYDRICRKLQISPDDHVVEIGTGWGGFAEHAVTNYGCRVTTTTISREQHEYAATRFRAAGLSDRITLLDADYRDLAGEYDKLVSIEMIEAVGERYLGDYFGTCSRLLRPNGSMALQAITMPDHRYDDYRRNIDFMKRYIFPGGFLPSPSAITDCVRRRTDFRLFHVEDFGSHYAKTLSQWRQNFWHHIAEVRALGFDDRFIRTWNYYLCFCEAAFADRHTGVSQFVLTKPASRLTPILM